ncbi:MAG TPA: hypothetical protein DCP90_02595 [Clostridiales bacterium]|nr:hypothetical protein [Clostridiales bacterium]
MKTEPNYKNKKYAHFDRRADVNSLKTLIESPKWVAKHGFYPFIHYVIEFKKFNNKTKKLKPKKRHVYYSSHIDRYIYELYAHKLNEVYNERLKRDCTNKCSIAYRNNFDKKSNIHFAKEVFDYIKQIESSYVIIGDFTSFFDKLDHRYLKERLCDLLNVEELPEDYYAVYKNITKFSYFELDYLTKANNIKYKSLNKRERVLELNDFREKKYKNIKKNTKSYGIPQGSPISAVLSNVYMIDFDRKINNLITTIKGIYRRYSDDFVMVIPKNECSNIIELWKIVSNIINDIQGLELQNEKTQVYSVENEKLTNCNDLLFEECPNENSIINYLGFSFNGMNIRIRDKTIIKYYYRMRRRIRKLNQTTNRSKAIALLHQVYEKYSTTGFNRRRDKKIRGNFLTYVNRAQEVFGENEPISSKTDNHLEIINRKIDKDRLKRILAQKS